MRIGEILGILYPMVLWQDQASIDAAEAAAKAAGQSYYNPLMQTSKTYKLYPGDIKFEDLNGNGYIDRGQNTVDDPGDRKIIGNEEPRLYFIAFTLFCRLEQYLGECFSSKEWVSRIGIRLMKPLRSGGNTIARITRCLLGMWETIGLLRTRMHSCLVTLVTMRLSMEVIRTLTRAI